MKPDLMSVQDAFFAAMASGYAQSVPKIKISEIPGSKAIPFVYGDFQVIDCWVVTPYSDRSDGFTMISHEGKPVWFMHFGGWYHKIAVPFLKGCLHRAYVDERRFYGGRGPQLVRDERFTYLNWMESVDFGKFKGAEAVFDLNEQRLGYHWYRGGSLLENHP